MQFILTGFFQTLLDITLICQMIIYRNAGIDKTEVKGTHISKDNKSIKVKDSGDSEINESG